MLRACLWLVQRLGQVRMRLAQYELLRDHAAGAFKRPYRGVELANAVCSVDRCWLTRFGADSVHQLPKPGSFCRIENPCTAERNYGLLVCLQ